MFFFWTRIMSLYFQSREWMDQRVDPENNCISNVYIKVVTLLFYFLQMKHLIERVILYCVYAWCKNVKNMDAKIVSRHIFSSRFREITIYRRVMEKIFMMLVRVLGQRNCRLTKMWEDSTRNVEYYGYHHGSEAYDYMGEDIAPHLWTYRRDHQWRVTSW